MFQTHTWLTSKSNTLVHIFSIYLSTPLFFSKILQDGIVETKTQVQGRYLHEELQGRPLKRIWRKDLDSATTRSNSRKCKFMKRSRRRPTHLSFYPFFSLVLSFPFWLSDIFTSDQDQPLVCANPIPKPTSEVKTMKIYQVQGRLHNKEETTIEAWRWSSRRQACEYLEKSIQVEELASCSVQPLVQMENPKTYCKLDYCDKLNLVLTNLVKPSCHVCYFVWFLHLCVWLLEWLFILWLLFHCIDCTESNVPFVKRVWLLHQLQRQVAHS